MEISTKEHNYFSELNLSTDGMRVFSLLIIATVIRDIDQTEGGYKRGLFSERAYSLKNVKSQWLDVLLLEVNKYMANESSYRKPKSVGEVMGSISEIEIDNVEQYVIGTKFMLFNEYYTKGATSNIENISKAKMCALHKEYILKEYLMECTFHNMCIEDIADHYIEGVKQAYKGIAGTHELYYKSAVVGVASAIGLAATSGIAAPAIGAFIGAAGTNLAGAAAVSHGLAILGGGAIAVGGGGMAAGMTTITLAGAVIGGGVGGGLNYSLWDAPKKDQVNKAIELEMLVSGLYLSLYGDVDETKAMYKSLRDATYELKNKRDEVEMWEDHPGKERRRRKVALQKLNEIDEINERLLKRIRIKLGKFSKY